jgi:hypothetical protein
MTAQPLKKYPTTCYSLTMTRIRRKGDKTLARYYLTKAARIRIKNKDTLGLDC